MLEDSCVRVKQLDVLEDWIVHSGTMLFWSRKHLFLPELQYWHSGEAHGVSCAVKKASFNQHSNAPTVCTRPYPLP